MPPDFGRSYALVLMAVMNSIPPQAYTRDTLVKAIEWMNTQPQALRERASSADLLVSYYLQACRKAAVQMEAPVSQESFKQDLRHLAEDLKQFEEPSAPPTHIQPTRSTSFGLTHEPHNHKVEPLFVAPPQQSHSHQPPQHAHAPVHSHHHHSHHSPQPPVPHSPAPQWNVDPKSLAIAREIQNKFNLSSEAEALRMLVSLGSERARQLFP